MLDSVWLLLSAVSSDFRMLMIDEIVSFFWENNICEK